MMGQAFRAARGTVLAAPRATAGRVGSVMDVIAERTLELRVSGDTEGKPILVRLGRPELEAERQDFRVVYEIHGPDPGDVRRGVARGEDSMQALVLALQILPAELATLRRRGELRWPGGEAPGVFGELLAR
jgi:uncharacterized protein DUF6968